MRIVVTGARGQVGSEVMRRAAEHPRVAVVGLGRDELDIVDHAVVARVVERLAPGLVVNLAAYTAVDRAEAERDTAFAVNHRGAATVAAVCAGAGVPVFHVSSDYVFDGRASTPYTETDAPAPLGVYGASKLEGERAVREAQPHHIILRTSWVFGVTGRNFVKTVLRLAREREELTIVSDQAGCPTGASDVADTILRLAGTLDRQDALPWGTYHYCGAPPTTWHGLAEEIVAVGRQYEPLRAERVRPISTADHPTPARRPSYSVLSCAKIQEVFGIQAPSWQHTLHRVIRELHGT